MHEWTPLSVPMQLPDKFTTTVNDHGQKNYKFKAPDGTPMFVPATYVKKGLVFAQPQPCQECSIKTAAASDSGNIDTLLLAGGVIGVIALFAWMNRGSVLQLSNGNLSPTVIVAILLALALLVMVYLKQPQLQ